MTATPTLARPSDCTTSATYTIRPDVPVTLVGPRSDWFATARIDGGVSICPRNPLPGRCAIRAAAVFQHAPGFPDVSAVMGRLLFQRGATEPQTYRPFTHDPNRRFREVLLLTEPAPDDELPASRTRWHNYEAVARRLLAAADVPWTGLTDIDAILADEPWYQPLEGCILHALAQYAPQAVQQADTTADAILEIGSLRGQSLAMIARGLCSAGQIGRDPFLISIDPHEQDPRNVQSVRTTLARCGLEGRLMQFTCRSDQAWPVIRPRSAAMVFIDGDHTYEQVIADFENYAPLLAPGGLLLFHDYGYGPHNGKPDVVPGVRCAVDERVMPRDDFGPLLLAHTLMAFRKK